MLITEGWPASRSSEYFQSLGPAVTFTVVRLWRGSLRSPLSFVRRLVPRAGFEPATYGLGIRCSVQLSYRSVWNLRF